MIKPDVMDGVPEESGIYLAKDNHGWCGVEYCASTDSYFKTGNELILKNPEDLTWSEQIEEPDE